MKYVSLVYFFISFSQLYNNPRTQHIISAYLIRLRYFNSHIVAMIDNVLPAPISSPRMNFLRYIVSSITYI